MYSQNQADELNFPPRLLLRIIILILLLFWTAVFANLIFTTKSGMLYPLTRKCFSLICHQDPEKSFTFAGVQMLVCARCAGIYLGAAITSLLLLFPFNLRLPHIKYFLIACIPMTADVLLYNSGAYAYNKILSFATGIVWGSMVFIFILAAIEKYFYTNE